MEMLVSKNTLIARINLREYYDGWMGMLVSTNPLIITN